MLDGGMMDMAEVLRAVTAGSAAVEPAENGPFSGIAYGRSLGSLGSLARDCMAGTRDGEFSDLEESTDVADGPSS